MALFRYPWPAQGVEQYDLFEWFASLRGSASPQSTHFNIIDCRRFFLEFKTVLPQPPCRNRERNTWDADCAALLPIGRKVVCAACTRPTPKDQAGSDNS